jgi:hypothetical protein
MAEFVEYAEKHASLGVSAVCLSLYRGIKARTPATVTLEKLALIPAIFLVWDITI